LLCQQPLSLSRPTTTHIVRYSPPSFVHFIAYALHCTRLTSSMTFAALYLVYRRSGHVCSSGNQPDGARDAFLPRVAAQHQAPTISLQPSHPLVLINGLRPIREIIMEIIGRLLPCTIGPPSAPRTSGFTLEYPFPRQLDVSCHPPLPS